MDESRRFRFLIPVFWFLGVFFLALYSVPSGFDAFLEKVVQQLGIDPKANSGTDIIVHILAALTAGGFLLLAVGFWITSVTVTAGYIITLIYRACYKIRYRFAKEDNKSKWFYRNFHCEYTIDKQERNDLEEDLRLEDHKGEFSPEYLVAAYHHGVLTGKPKDFQEYLTRRFTIFWIGANCCTAHVLALLLFMYIMFMWDMGCPDVWRCIAIMFLGVPVLCNMLLARRFIREATRLSLASKIFPGTCPHRRE